MKYLLIRFSDDNIYRVPAEMVAINRAEYYAMVDTKDTGDESEYNRLVIAETQYALQNTSELLDWANNNMNWEDLKSVAVLHKLNLELPNYDDEYPNAEKSVEELNIVE